MHILEQEKISAYSHGVLVPVMAAGTILLMVLAGKKIELRIFLLIYGLSAVILFTASFLYHAEKKFLYERSVWRKLDRSAIFVLIAGTATPMCFLYLDSFIMRGVLVAQWLLVISGIAFCFFINAPRKISTIIYILMGCLVIFPFITSITVMPAGIFALFIAGVLSYIAGAVVYAVKKPILLKKLGFHEAFHMFVIAGAVFHLLMIIVGVTIYTR